MPIEPELAESPTFRNPNGVQLKVYNFAAIDPEGEIEGMSHGGVGDQLVFDEFASNPERLHVVAEAIRANLDGLRPAEAEVEEEGISEAAEGAVLTRVHRVRERSAKLIAAKKRQVMDAEGALRCEGCAFDFHETYGDRGEGFIECHHTRPVSELTPGERTRIEDLALVCCNCHRMIHVRRPWLSMSELRSLVG